MMKVLVVLMLVCSVYTNEIKTLSDQQPCLQDIHAALREITASLAKQEVEMKYLQAENKEQAAKQQTEVDELKKQLQGKQVAFSASLCQCDAISGQAIGPSDTPIPLVYKHVVTNIGKAYSPVTGNFTAPLKGAYHFEWHVFGVAGAYSTAAYLVKNSEQIFLAYEDLTAGWASASNSATLLLEAGDVVSVRLHINNQVYDDTDHINTFSGHLLFTV